jgi:SAM-dependent methyltransferase
MRQRIPGYAIVKQEQPIALTEGRGTVRFTDVASQIDPTTVTFASLTDPDGTSVLEQNYEFDLVSTAKLMERFLDRAITVEQAQGDRLTTFTGKLLSTAGGIVLQGADGGVQVIQGYSNVQFPELPGGLITKPTLVWDVFTEKPGEHRTRVTYETKAMTWWSDYNIVFAEGKDANSGVLDIGAWDGRVTASLREFFGSTIAVEPHPDRFRQLAKRESDHFSAVNATIEELMEDPNALQTKPDVILMSHLLYHLRTPIDEDVDLQALLWAREQLAPGGILIIILNDTNPRPGTRAHFRRTVRRGEKNQNPQQYVEFLRQRNALVQVMHPILRFEARTPEGKDALQDIMQWMLPPEVRWLEPRIDEYRTKYTQNSDGQEAFEHALAIIVAHRDPSASPLQTTHLL